MLKIFWYARALLPCWFSFCEIFRRFLFDSKFLVVFGVSRAFLELLVTGNNLFGVMLLWLGQVGVFANAAQEVGFSGGEVEFVVSKDFTDLRIECSSHFQVNRIGSCGSF